MLLDLIRFKHSMLKVFWSRPCHHWLTISISAFLCWRQLCSSSFERSFLRAYPWCMENLLTNSVPGGCIKRFPLHLRPPLQEFERVSYNMLQHVTTTNQASKQANNQTNTTTAAAAAAAVAMNGKFEMI